MVSDIYSHYPCLQGLEPADFFRWFGEICRIPHGSYHEQALTRWLCDFAAQRNIPWEEDEVGNVLMRLAPTEGYADQPAVLFQAHMDMVWAKEAQVAFDFSTQSLSLQVQNGRLDAAGTTLGADNAVGMATMLALADGNYPHPALELLFTTTEEVGLLGIRKFNKDKLQARRMVNMDCGDSHVICVSSAGKNCGAVQQTFPLQPIPPGYTGLQVEISGGLGGHGSLSANKGRCCAGNALGDLLTALSDFRLCQIQGAKPIMPCASAVIAAPVGAEAVLKTRFETIAKVFEDTDPNIHLTLTPCPLPVSAVGAEDSRRIALALSLLRTTQYRADGNDPRLIVTVGVLNEISLENGEFSLGYAVHSTISADLQLYYDRCKTIISLLGMELYLTDQYHGWPERKNSPFREKFQTVHNALFGSDLEIERCPGGIEVGDLIHHFPDMDAIGIAPTARGAHTPGEYLLIDEVMPYWQLITAVLAQKEDV